MRATPKLCNTLPTPAPRSNLLSPRNFRRIDLRVLHGPRTRQRDYLETR